MAKLRQVGGPKSGRPIMTGNTFGYVPPPMAGNAIGNGIKSSGARSLGPSMSPTGPAPDKAINKTATDPLTPAQRRRRTIRQSLGIRLDGTQSASQIATLRSKGGLPQKKKRPVRPSYPVARGGGGGGGG